jgi:hypothetical protein
MMSAWKTARYSFLMVDWARKVMKSYADCFRATWASMWTIWAYTKPASPSRTRRDIVSHPSCISLVSGHAASPPRQEETLSHILPAHPQ